MAAGFGPYIGWLIVYTGIALGAYFTLRAAKVL